jgi:hypothetical protein
MYKSFLIILMIFLVSCTFWSSIQNEHEVKVGDGGFLSLNPCGPPCFYGITPGITTDAQVQEIITNFKDIFPKCEETDLTRSGGGRSLSCADGIGMSYNNHLVDGISFSPSVNLSIQQVIDLYGSPDLVEVIVLSLTEAPIKSTMVLYYDDLHTALGLDEQSGTSFIIDPDSKISSIAYHTENSYNDFRTLAIKIGTPWQGFGTYQASFP